MKIDKSFVLRVLAVFLATLVTVWGIQFITGYYNYDGTLNTFILAILVAQVYDELIDPRRKRNTNSNLLVMKKDIEDLKTEIKFLKYYLHKSTGVDLEELQVRSSIWKDIQQGEEDEQGDKYE